MKFKNFFSFLLWGSCLLFLLTGCKNANVHVSPTSSPPSTTQPTSYPASNIGGETLQYPGKSANYEYNVYETYVAITEYTGSDVIVSVPETIDGLPVKVISGFSHSSVEKVHLPNSIIVINNCAFDGCSKLEEINIPEGVEEIGWRAFEECFALRDITIPRSVKKIGDKAFGQGGSHRPLENLTIHFYKGTAGAKYVADLAGLGIKYEIIDAQ